MTPSDLTRLDAQLHGLHLHYIQSHYQALATKAAEQQRSHLDYLEQLVEGEATMRENRSIERRIKNARFPVLKSLDDFQWSWPKKINRPQIQNLFPLAFIATRTNIVLIGNVGLGKTHLSIGRTGFSTQRPYGDFFLRDRACTPRRQPLLLRLYQPPGRSRRVFLK
jgi:DNA replication protein DnaC